MSTTAAGAARRWAELQAASAVPHEIRAAGPEWHVGHDVDRFSRAADRAVEAETPSQRVAREALSDGGSVLDVGCGGGAGALPLAPPAGHLIGVDASEGMLAAFAERAAARGVAFTTVAGRWPDVADDVPLADVVVSHNVVYGVRDLPAFARALTGHARSRVVLQLTAQRPTEWLRLYWWHLHGLDRPAGPTADDALAVLREEGYEVGVARWERSMSLDRTADDRVEFVRHRLYLGAEHDPDIRELLERYPPPAARTSVTAWWSP